MVATSIGPVMPTNTMKEGHHGDRWIPDKLIEVYEIKQK